MGDYARYSGLTVAIPSVDAANRHLSNLESPTAINQALIAGSNGTATALSLQTANQASGNSANIALSTGTSVATRGLISLDSSYIDIFHGTAFEIQIQPNINQRLQRNDATLPVQFIGSISDTNSVNQDIVFGSSDITIPASISSPTLTNYVWLASGSVSGDSDNAMGAGNVILHGGNCTGPFDLSGDVNILAGSATTSIAGSGSVFIESGIAGAASSGSVSLVTGTSVGSPSGNINLTTGAASGSTRGAVVVDSIYLSSTGPILVGTTTTQSNTPILAQESGVASDQSIKHDVYAASNSGGYTGRRARGTSGSPTAAQSGDNLSFFSGFGYGATGFPSNSTGNISFTAGQNFTDSAQGTHIDFKNAPNGSVTKATNMRVAQSGNVLIGTTTDDATNKLQVNGTVSSTRVKTKNLDLLGSSAGTLTITVPTSFTNYTLTMPSAETSDGVLVDNGTGTLSWTGRNKFSSVAVPTKVTASSYAVLTTDAFIRVDTTGNAITATLPDPSTRQYFYIRDVGANLLANNLTLARNGSEKINGAASNKALITNSALYLIFSDGTDWWVNVSITA